MKVIKLHEGLKITISREHLKNMNITRIIIAGTFVALLSVLILAPSFGGPGDNDDPIVTLSYMELASSFGEIIVQKGKTFPIESGTLFVLIEGKAEINGVGDYELINLTSGKSQVRGKALIENNLCLINGGSNLELVAGTNVKILVRGGETKLQRQGM
jgi:hypothetical protein